MLSRLFDIFPTLYSIIRDGHGHDHDRGDCDVRDDRDVLPHGVHELPLHALLLYARVRENVRDP